MAAREEPDAADARGTRPVPRSGATPEDRPIRIVARTNGVGIDRDVRLLQEAFSTWREPPSCSHYHSVSPFHRWLGPHDPGETILYLERVTARWLGRAGRYLLIPNQERYPHRLVRLLRRVDHVLCKSRHAEAVFGAVHDSVHYLGFTSVDRLLPEAEPDYGRFFHLAGGSALKGTDTLLEVWARHPEWPTLTLVFHRKGAVRDSLPANVELIDTYLPDEELRALQNACGVHLCPSLSEGWGHYIVEAMSCAAVPLVTDGPPMNELVTAERGVVVPWHRSEPRKMGVNYYVDPDALEAAIADLVERPEDEKVALGRAARAWFEENDATFRTRLREVWEALER